MEILCADILKIMVQM